jgi:hypothetical protein
MKSLLFMALAVGTFCVGTACASAPVKNKKSTKPVPQKSAKPSTVELVQDGKPRASLVFDSRRYPLKEDVTDMWLIYERPMEKVVAEVADYVFKSTGAKLPIIDLAKGAAPKGQVLIHVGRSGYVDTKLGRELDGIDPSGFLIRTVDAQNVVIAGSTSEGTEFGAFEFLERFVGIRWLLPTDIGDYVPKQKNLITPLNTKIKEEPAFLQVPHIAVGPHQQMWSRHMRFWNRLKYHHNLKYLFPPEKYTATHPEFYPVLTAGSTERFLPPPNTEDWQPCFTAPGLVDEAAKNIIAYLDTNPRIKSYSFGINDTSQHRFCKCENCLKEYIEGETFLGMPSYSDVYYKFTNAVIEKVLKVHPDTWFGCIAYNNVGSPPVNVRLHPRLVPFLTYDTMQTLDPERRKRHEAMVDEWNKKTTYIGRYDYTYGADHVPPRIYIHHWADYVRWARDHKVKAWSAETYPFFGEAPKYYVMAKIWWNPDRNVDAILNEWYRLSFGKASAPMKAYFDHWENYWTKRVTQGGYFRVVKDEQYLLGAIGWMEQLKPEDVAKADAWIAQAGKLADTPETKARVAVMARSWQYYRAVIQTYLSGGGGGRLSADNALAILEKKQLEPDYSIRTLHETLDKDPLLNFTWPHSYPYKDTERAPFLGGIESYLDNHDERLKRELEKLKQDPDARVAALAGTVLGIADGSAPNLVPNGSFEEAEALKGWWAGMHMGTGSALITGEKAYDGANALEVKGTFDGFGGTFRTDIPVQAGKRYLYVVRARWQGTPTATTKSQLVTYYLDKTGVEIPETRRLSSFLCSNNWQAYVIETAEVPQNAVSMAVRAEAFAQPQTGHSAFFDNLQVFEISGAAPR